MKKTIIIIKIFLVYFFLTSHGVTKESNYLKRGIELFQKEEFEKSKILFEQSIVFDPKNEKSYLYLAKIFNNNNKSDEQEVNLNSVLLLNPSNDEAIYMLAMLKIEQSDYNRAKELLDKFVLVCESFCLKKKEIQEKLEKMNPENAENNN
jgi:Tfp pilus assembly protein PilF|tara:strand:+ start:2276 stop:2725 length:450 start_codon:yes stop_codon:yes gene_type:complete